MPIVIVPGLGGSGAGHWQSHWERRLGAVRFEPSSWDRPDPVDWARALGAAVAAGGRPPVVVAHSLGCLTVADWAREHPASVTGVVLVAVPDPAGPAFPAVAVGFGPFDPRPLGVPALVVGSRDDPYATAAFAMAAATAWGAEFEDAGAVGHVNEASGLGEWPAGLAMLDRFLTGTGGGDRRG